MTRLVPELQSGALANAMRNKRLDKERGERESGAAKWALCPHCKKLMPAFRSSCARRTCPGFSPLCAGDTRQRLFRALEAFGGDVTMVTVTAPGQSLLPWDRALCRALGEHLCSGDLGCQSKGSAEWNESAPKRWRELHDVCRSHTRRNAGEAPELLARVWEYQKRGVLHLHLLLAFDPWQRPAVLEYVDRLSANAPGQGFGFVDRKRKVLPALDAAAYLTSYLVSGKGKLTLTETVKRRDVPPMVVYVSRKYTQQTGVTMRTLRLKRYLWWKVGPDGLRIAEHLSIPLKSLAAYVDMGLWCPDLINSLMGVSTQ